MPSCDASGSSTRLAQIDLVNVSGQHQPQQATRMPDRVKGPAPKPHSKTKHKQPPVQELDLSGSVPCATTLSSLPRTLVELRITGCGLATLPACISSLTALKRLFAGANRIHDISPLLALGASLQHVGLAHNPLAALPQPHLMHQLCELVSLDLSYCCLEDLRTAQAALVALPALQSLTLAGNPFCLLPTYPSAVRTGWPRPLRFLDGQASAAAPGSRPTTSDTPTLRDADTPSTSSGTTTLTLHLSNLSVLEDPYAPLRSAWAAEAAAAQAAGTPVTYTVPAPPPQPYIYHYELYSYDGHLKIRDALQLSSALQSVTVGVLQAAIDRECERPDTSGSSGSQEAGAGEPTEAPATDLPAVDNSDGNNEAPQEGEAEEETPQTPSATTTCTLERTRPTCQVIPAIPPDPLSVAQHLSRLLEGAATAYCSVPQRLPVPAAPSSSPESQAAPDNKTAKKPPATPPGKGASKPSTPQTAAAPASTGQSSVTPGSLQVSLPFPATTAARDWLHTGIRVHLYRTAVTAVPKPVTATPEPPPSTPPTQAKGDKAASKGKGKVEEPVPDTLDLSKYDLVTDTRLVGQGVISAGPLVAGQTSSHQCEVLCVPVAQLWDAKGYRMPLEDDRHSRDVLAKIEAKLVVLCDT